MIAWTRRFLTTGCALAALALGAGRSSAETPPPATESSPEARRLLDKVAAAYAALPAYADQGAFELALTVNGTPTARKLPVRFTFVRPNRLALETGLARIVSDGKTLTTVLEPLRQYTTRPAPETITFDTVFTGGPVGSELFGGPVAPMMTLLTSLLFDHDPSRAVRDLGDRLDVAKDRDLAGRPCRTLTIRSETGPGYDLLVDPESKLLREIDVQADPKALAGAFPAGLKVAIERYRWTSGPISVRPAEAAAFAFQAPEGFRAVGGLAEAAAGAKKEEEPQFKVQALVGKAAPAFTMTLLDGEGKTRTVSRDDLAGKVVMIDFWATWCGPCLKELPEVQKLIESYGKAKKDVVIVALSQDDDPRDPVEVRKLIESTLKKQKLDLTATPVGKVGLDPSNSVGAAFQVEGYPTVVLLDRQGKVRSAHVGYNPNVGKTLAREIDALLEGKPLGGD